MGDRDDGDDRGDWGVTGDTGDTGVGGDMGNGGDVRRRPETVEEGQKRKGRKAM